MDIVNFSKTALTPEELVGSDRVLADLTRATRGLCDAQLRTEAPLAEVEQVTAEVRALTARLLGRSRAGSLGMELDPDGGGREHGNALLGLRNPFAAAVGRHAMFWNDHGARAELELGALYEGPPSCVHGGVIALLLDQLFTEAAAAAGHPGMTANLTVSYRRPTPLGRVTVTGWLDRVEGSKRVLNATCHDADGNLTAEGEALLILPRWITPDTVWPKRPPRRLDSRE